MPRPLRIVYPGACYHVMNRGSSKQKIFKNNFHRTIFITLLRECCKLFNINIFAYCLMDNHYHLLLSTPEANLSRVMRHLNGVYTQKYNRLMKTDGALFRGRYLAKLVEEDSYRLLLTRYIHLNPVEAGIVKNPADYKWSSYLAYLECAPNRFNWISTKPIIQQLKATISLSHVKNYKDYVEIKHLDEINVFISTKYSLPIIGSRQFVNQSLEKVDSLHLEACSSDVSHAKIYPTIELIREKVCSFYQIDFETLIKTNFGAKNLPKLIFIYLCNKEFSHPLRSIATFTGYARYESISAAARKCERELNRDITLKREALEITASIWAMCE